ncbi:MAG: hypothetical protein HY817_03235 [Candidatus Abawacabacteria bacterium]|nr:hypothetical protein [Candidatus Abawacabacteria bacterium]
MKNKGLFGFSTLEIMIYLAMTTVVISSTSFLLIQFVRIQIRMQVITQVEEQGWQIMHLITQNLRNADSVNATPAGGQTPSLTLDMADSALDPMSFHISGGTFRIKEGGGSPIPLSTANVLPSNLSFRNLAEDNDTPGVVQVSFTLTYNNTSGRPEYNYSKTFYGSAAVRKVF